MARSTRYGKGLAFSVFPMAVAACSLSSQGSSDVAAHDTQSPPSGASSTHADASIDDASLPHGDDDGDTTPDDASIADVATPLDASTADVIVFGDGGDAGASVPCDVDKDGHLAKGGGCGGDDCCDADGRVFPGQTAFFDQPSACETFDYDCDGKASPKFAREACKLEFLTCSGDGFALDTACGTQGDFVSCGFVPIFCNQTKSTRLQECN